MMKRTLINDLIKWKKKENRKPLILKGVRQCGKTYLLKTFGKEHYSSVAYFNFEENENLKTVFEKDYDTSRIILELGLFAGQTIKPNETLVIFDEIQIRKPSASNNSHTLCGGGLSWHGEKHIRQCSY